MTLAPVSAGPYQDHYPCEDDPDEQEQADDLHSKKYEKKWGCFLREQVRGVALCEYHALFLWWLVPDDVPTLRDNGFLRRVKRARNLLVRENCLLCDYLVGASDHLGKSAVMVILYEPHHESHEQHRYVTGLPTANIMVVNEREDLPTGPILLTFGIEFEGYESHRGVKSRHLSATSINYAILSGWLEQCVQAHSCGPDQPDGMTSLKLIDCQTRCVVHAPDNGCRYVALSYVWGNANAAQADATKYPYTIEDAITVTIALGIRYLWVDQYCIDQGDEAEKHSQIQMMDQIYINAQLCIIAAAGDDAHYGSPGVDYRPRKPQKRFSLGTLTLVQQCCTAQNLAESKWSSRAWTFQEGYLARRRLIFTDEEVVFQCGEMYCQESRYWDGWTELDPRSEMLYDGRMSDFVPWPLNRSREAEHDALYDRRVRGLLAQYSRRYSSFDEDAIHAFQGMFKYLGVRHCWGMPFEYPYKQDEMALNIAWSSDAPRKRRSGFPTWSWASIEGCTSVDETPYTPHAYNVEVSLSKGQWVTSNDYIKMVSSPEDSNLSRLIRVTGYICRPHFVSAQWIRENISHNFSTSNTDIYAIVKCLNKSNWFRIYSVRVDFGDVTIDDLSNAVALFISATPMFDKHMILRPAGSCVRRVGYMESFGLPRENMESRHSKFRAATFTQVELVCGLDGQEFLERTDDDFTEMLVKRTIVLE